MNLSDKEYKKYAEAKAKKSNLATDCVNAFWTGGSICLLGEILHTLYIPLGLGVKHVGTCFGDSYFSRSSAYGAERI